MTPPRPTVYLIAQPTVKKNGRLPDLSALDVHGRVVILLDKDTIAPHRDPGGVLRLLESKLSDFNPDVDFLAWAGGDTLAALLVGAILENWNINKFTWLRYQRVRLPGGSWTDDGATYEPVTVDLAA